MGSGNGIFLAQSAGRAMAQVLLIAACLELFEEWESIAV